MLEIQIKSWSHFVSIAEKCDVSDDVRPRYAFRGQADSKWELQPSLLRILSERGFSEEKAIEIEGRALAEFKSQVHLHISANTFSNTKDTVSFWSLMQHHGAPSRLLDWCLSAYVGAYFAVTGSPNADGAIWLIHLSTVEQLMQKNYEGTEMPATENESQEKFLKVGGPPAIIFGGRLSRSHRMVTQQGVFSICRNVLGNHGKILRDIIPDSSDKTFFAKLIVPNSLKSEFLLKLRGMNITANSLFPGLDGLGKSITEYVQVIAR